MTDEQGIGYWWEWVYDPATKTYTQRPFVGVRPGPEDYEMARDARGNPVVIEGQTVYIRKGATAQSSGPSGPMRMPVTPSAWELEAGQSATVDGYDIAILTDYAKQLLRQGVKRDERGFFEYRKGEKVYLTGTEGGLRGKYVRDPLYINAPPQFVPFEDEIAREAALRTQWATITGTDEQLRARLRDKNSELERLRARYKGARGDGWTYRENLLDRIRDLEDEITGLHRSLGADPGQPPQFVLHGPFQSVRKGGMTVTMGFGLYQIDQPVQFSDGLSVVPGGAHVLVRLTIAFDEEPSWRPGQLAHPDVVRIKWTPAIGFAPMDNVPSSGTDEFVNSNPLVVIRDFRAPPEPSWVGGPAEDSPTTLMDKWFGADVQAYRLVVDELLTPDKWHWEGDDGYFGSIITNPDAPGAGALAQFMQGLCLRETNCNPSRVNKQTGAFGKWQIMPRNWPSWSKEILGKNPAYLVRDPITGQMMWPKTEANIEAVSFGIAAQIYKRFGSWRRTAVAWHHGRSWARQHPLAGLPGQPPLGLERYVRYVLTHAGLPMD